MLTVKEITASNRLFCKKLNERLPAHLKLTYGARDLICRENKNTYVFINRKGKNIYHSINYLVFSKVVDKPIFLNQETFSQYLATQYIVQLKICNSQSKLNNTDFFEFHKFYTSMIFSEKLKEELNVSTGKTNRISRLKI